jgi:hypothetical protein
MESVFDLFREMQQTLSVVISNIDAFPSPLTTESDARLTSLLREASARRHELDTVMSLIGAEVGRRSRPELGSAGIARSSGAVTAVKFIEREAGLTTAEAGRLVRVGNMLTDASSPAGGDPGSGPRIDGGLDPTAGAAERPATPWHQVISDAVLGRSPDHGLITTSQAESLRRGLGTATESFDDQALRELAATLLRQISTFTPSARDARDLADRAGVADRYEAARARRYLRIWKDDEGMVRLSGLFDPEAGQELLAIAEIRLGPRIGGPRFVDPEQEAADKKLLGDDRLNEQIVADTFVDLVRCGTHADPNQVFSKKRPAVRYVVPAAELDKTNGVGFREADGMAVPRTVIERRICDGGVIPVLLDPEDASLLNLGREQRLFSTRQRIGLAVRDGGCRWPGCNKSPSMCEAHHANHWKADHGKTDVDDGVLLCRHHHLLLHNQNWAVRRLPSADGRPGHDFHLVPPRERDPRQTPIPMPSKSSIDKYWASETQSGATSSLARMQPKVGTQAKVGVQLRSSMQAR